MGKLIVVKNDKVEGIDKHNVTGMDTSSPPVPYKGIGEFDYVGKITEQLIDFIQINGKEVAVKSSKSSLNPGEDVKPAGKHTGPKGENFVPSAPAPNLETLTITEPVGEGKPNVNSGSSFVSVGGTAILLDGDKIDTCDGTGSLGNSTVNAGNQDFISCSE